MLRDLYFYPLAALAISLIIGLALSFGNYDRPSDAELLREGYTMEGEDLTKLTTGTGTHSEFIAAVGDTPAFARLWSDIARDNIPPYAGVFAPLNSDMERAFAGRRLRMTVTARQSRNDPLTEFDMAYFTAGPGDSGWQRRQLTSDWAEYSFEFTPPLPTAEPDIDYFGIWPGDTAEPLSMDVAKMRIEVLDNSTDGQ
ncbi:hypothetical protein ACJ3XI_11365 [Litorimonas sp. RW-G-Af-16]|uniref:hypothetical protein n=1 Tax=Litorimonas sp. RW-G-Af-16 TaxID=3241168 RepID=UPI00390C595A